MTLSAPSTEMPNCCGPICRPMRSCNVMNGAGVICGSIARMDAIASLMARPASDLARRVTVLPSVGAFCASE